MTTLRAGSRPGQARVAYCVGTARLCVQTARVLVVVDTACLIELSACCVSLGQRHSVRMERHTEVAGVALNVCDDSESAVSSVRELGCSR